MTSIFVVKVTGLVYRLNGNLSLNFHKFAESEIQRMKSSFDIVVVGDTYENAIKNLGKQSLPASDKFHNFDQELRQAVEVLFTISEHKLTSGNQRLLSHRQLTLEECSNYM